MKTIYTLIVMMMLAASTFSQNTFEGFNYQAVVRNTDGNPLPNNTTVSFQISILKGSSEGTPIYIETHTKQTNQFGLVNFTIGDNTSGNNIIGDFMTIDWGNDNYYVKIELDITGGTNYTDMGTQPLLYIPYAKHAKTAENALSASYNNLTDKPVSDAITNSGSGKVITNEERYKLNNSQQTLNVSTTGDTLYISGGNHIIVPGISAANSAVGNVQEAPPGSIIAFGGDINHIPDGWLPCDGREVDRDDYSRLFEAIQINWGGGNGITTFNIPDLQGIFLRGVDNGQKNDPDAEERTAMAEGGNIGDNVGSKQLDAIRNITGQSVKVALRIGANPPEANGAFHYSSTEYVSFGDISNWSTACLNFDASRIVPTASDNRPINAYVWYIIKY